MRLGQKYLRGIRQHTLHYNRGHKILNSESKTLRVGLSLLGMYEII